jgi:hypothetical protein
MDTQPGLVANITVCVLLALIAIAALVRMVVMALISPPAPDAPASAIAPWIIYLVVAVVAAAVAYAMAPKLEQPAPGQENTPEVEDGQAVIEVYGTVWIDSPFILAWKMVGRDKIKSKGGKK